MGNHRVESGSQRLKTDRRAKVTVYNLLEEYCDALSLQDEKGTCIHAEVHSKLHHEVPFPTHPYAIKEKQNLAYRKRTNMPRKTRHYQEGFAWYNSPLLLEKKCQYLHRVCTNIQVLNDKLVKMNHTFNNRSKLLGSHDCC